MGSIEGRKTYQTGYMMGGKHELAKEHESTNLFLMMSLFMSISSKFVDASSDGRSVCLSEVWLVCPLNDRLVRVP